MAIYIAYRDHNGILRRVKVAANSLPTLPVTS